MKSIIFTVGIVLSASLMASIFESLKTFFNSNKIGRSADYGVFKKDRDHVISIHGFDEDLDICLEIVLMLNQEQPDTYSCKPLNH